MKRVTIQKHLAGPVTDVVNAAAEALGLDPNNKSHQRRLFRALVAIGAAHLLDEKAPAVLVLNEACRAVAEEVEARANIAVAHGNPFGLPPPANA